MYASLYRKLASLSASKPDGWLSVEDVRSIGAFPLDVLSNGSSLSKVLEINPRLKLARVLNLEKDGLIKIDCKGNEVSSRVIRLKNPEYRQL